MKKPDPLQQLVLSLLRNPAFKNMTSEEQWELSKKERDRIRKENEQEPLT